MPALARPALCRIPLQVIDDIAAALDGADIFFAVTADRAPRTVHFAYVGRAIALNRGQAVAPQLLRAARREIDRGLPDLIALGVILNGQPIEAAKDQQRGKNLRQPY
jgi:hypothetical protein